MTYHNKMAAHGGDSLVKNFCSPRNILYAHNKTYLQLLEELCLLGALKANPKTKKTIIVPDAKLTSELVALLKTAGEDEVAQLCRMLVLKGYVDDLSDIGSTPTISGKLIPVESADKNKATVKDGGKIAKMSVGVRNLGPEPVFSVYELSGALVPIGAPAEGKEAPPKKSKKGGAETASANSRRLLFERAISETVVALEGKDPSTQRDPSLEILCSLADYFSTEEKEQEIADGILSAISDDTLTSLFLVLRPHAASSPYLSDDQVARWANASNTPGSILFCFKNPYTMIKEAAACHKELAATVKKIQEQTVENIYKPGYMQGCNAAYAELLKAVQACPSIGNRNKLTVEDLKFETEVRVSAAIHRDNTIQFGVSANDLNQFYARYTNGAIHLTNTASMSANDTSAAVYLSLYYTSVRSDGFFYLRCLGYDAALADSVMAETDSLLSLTKGLFADHSTYYEEIAKYVQRQLKAM